MGLKLSRNTRQQKSSAQAGKLRIGDDWNAIRIIALSQTNPLKAVAEFVENSIDAKAKRITLTRGKEKGVHFLRIKDDGEGIRRDVNGLPDFGYVATHICDSIKRRLKEEGATGIQGEFGIGLLSFWIIGEELVLTSAGANGKTYQMHMRRGDPGYRILEKRVLLSEPGTELLVKRILPGIKQLSGEKIQWYLAAELRDRIRRSGVEVRVVDRTARAEFKVEPRQFEGRLLHQLGKAASGSELYLELYLWRQSPGNVVGLYRQGTRVLENLASLAEFAKEPWTSGYLQGIVDAPYLNLTPGTRSGLLQDQTYVRFATELAPVEEQLRRMIEEQQRAEEERTSREVLRSIQRALKEALLALPVEEYDWFQVHAASGKKGPFTPSDDGRSEAPTQQQTDGSADEAALVLNESTEEDEPPQKQFFEFAGPLFSVKISPASSTMAVESSRTFRAVARDRSRRLVEQDLVFKWEVAEGEGTLENPEGEIATFHAPKEPGLTRLRVTVKQCDIECSAEALVTVTDSLVGESQLQEATKQGIPNYTFQKAPGELWRSRFDAEKNVIVINNGHRDFVFASRNNPLKLRYVARLFAKELVVRNFPGVPAGELLERLIELSLYVEENLK
jgi:Histidine kinase-, DNA gyrase B-, and HSP90-like ATPase